MPKGKRHRKTLKWWANYALRVGSLTFSFFRLFM